MFDTAELKSDCYSIVAIIAVVSSVFALLADDLDRTEYGTMIPVTLCLLIFEVGRYTDRHNRRQTEPRRDVADLLRSGLVFSVAAMDSYFTARFAELLVPFLKKHGPTDGLVTLLDDAGLDTREALEMIEMARPYRRVRTLMDSYFDRYWETAEALRARSIKRRTVSLG